MMTLNVPPDSRLPVDDGLSAPSGGSADAVRGAVPLMLTLRHGDDVAGSVPYELVGSKGAPLLIVAGGISAGRHVVSSAEFPEAGWWQAQAGSLEQRRFRILSFDWLGADGLVDAPIDPADQATVAVRLLAELGLGKAAAFIGASYGGMVGMHVAADYPHCIGALLAISAAARPHPYSSACRALQRRALALGESGGEAAAGVALARALAMLTYRTPEEFADRFAAGPEINAGQVRVAAEAYLDAHGERHCRRMSATAYRRLSESIDLHRIDPSAISVPLTAAGVDADALVPAPDVRALAEAVPGSRFHLIQSRYGHDAFLKEEGQVAAIITEFLETLECAE